MTAKYGPRLTVPLFLALMGTQAGAEEWLTNPARPDMAPLIVPALVDPATTLFVEVPVSRLEAAIERLAEFPAVAQEPHDAQYFLRTDFPCPKGTSLYLLRAVYGNGRTGGYSLTIGTTALRVSHNGMGSHFTPRKSALLACLPAKPVSVYVTAGR